MKNFKLMLFVVASIFLFLQSNAQIRSVSPSLKVKSSQENNAKLLTEELKKMIAPVLSEEQEKKIYNVYVNYYKKSVSIMARQRELGDSTTFYFKKYDRERDSLIYSYLTKEQYNSLIAAREKEALERKKRLEQLRRLNE